MQLFFRAFAFRVFAMKSGLRNGLLDLLTAQFRLTLHHERAKYESTKKRLTGSANIRRFKEIRFLRVTFGKKIA